MPVISGPDSPGRARLGTVLVRGASMEPALHEGDCLLVRWTGPVPSRRVRPGTVVVARLHDRPGLLVVKRVAGLLPHGVQLVSDNASAPGAVSGPGEALGVVLACWWPRPRLVRRCSPG
jgi:phage repressor protein C with HTH and peptisase S24 domain